jgi:Fibronectin type III domain
MLLASILNPSFLYAAGSVTLTWQPSSSPDVTGYYIYYGLNSGAYDNEISAGDATSVVISNLVEGATYYFAATSHDGGESPFSNEASYTVPINPANPPASITLPAMVNGQFNFNVGGSSGQQYVVESSSDLVHWLPVFTNAAPFTFVATNTLAQSRIFYRAVFLTQMDNSSARLTRPQNTNNLFSFTVIGLSGRNYVVQTSTDLIHWSPVLTNTAPFTLQFTNGMNQTQQFYRAIIQN